MRKHASLCCSHIQVKKAAMAAMSTCFKLQGNRDIEPCVPLMLSCIARPAEANNAITKLSATTFVQVGVCVCVCRSTCVSVALRSSPVEAVNATIMLSATFVQVHMKGGQH